MEPLLLLHGAIGASQQLHPLKDQLSKEFKIYTPDFSGHGGKAFSEESFSMELFATDVLQFMEQEHLDRVSLFGYSMGGYVGMYLAKHYPERINKVITLATKYHWDEAIAAKEIQMLNPEKIEQKLPAFAQTLRERHAPPDSYRETWKEVLKMTADMMVALGNDNTLETKDYTSIMNPALLLLGDKDKMVSLEETLAVYKGLPNAQMGMLPGTQHPIEQVDIELLAFMITRFLNAR